MESIKRRFIYTEETPTVDIYYGKVSGGTSNFIPTAEYIKANFNTASGDVGGSYPNPKQYNFNTLNGYYVYFVFKDLPSGSTYGSRAINAVRIPGETGYNQVSGYGGGPVYKYKQLEPPTTQLPDASTAFVVYYGKINIDGIIYRVWKSGLYNVQPILNVYNIT